MKVYGYFSMKNAVNHTQYLRVSDEWIFLEFRKQ